jgi:hypothetical protein
MFQTTLSFACYILVQHLSPTKLKKLVMIVVMMVIVMMIVLIVMMNGGDACCPKPVTSLCNTSAQISLKNW